MKNKQNGNFEDSGQIKLALTADFKPYNNKGVYYRKFGNIVEIRGEISPAKAGTGSTTRLIVATLPEGVRPSTMIFTVCSASGLNRHEVAVYGNGDITTSRFGTSTYGNYSPDTWLTFYVSYVLG